MRLYLVRHATAVPRGSSARPQDAQRPLTPDGEREAERIAEGLKRLKLGIELVVTSPWARAVQTAERIAQVLGRQAPVRELSALRGDADPSETSLALKAFAGYHSVLLVGHEPHLSAWLAELVVLRGGLQVVIKKGGVACVEVKRVPPSQGSGTLRWLMTPKQLTLIGKG
ncbi:MAG: phosphohistidine phosphatase SixA [Candidatus Omnitrophica bacterium CG11_big_fil_rev_8_21_14_0_20_63_9]|nr:MAG: phosphohistidine phosphatase SixA [Candidatus Omnitrophica bacterium CG11_big_fil_rev_8_21_14_0_20_63_9]